MWNMYLSWLTLTRLQHTRQAGMSFAVNEYHFSIAIVKRRAA
jgi:hypothetical protein